MKRFVALILGVVVVITAEDLYNQEQINITKGFMDECKKNTEISQEKIEEMMDRIFNEDEKSREYMLCLYKKFHFMKEDGTVNKDNLRKFFGRHQLAGETLDKCINKKASTPAATSYKITKCYMQSLPPHVRGWVRTR